MTSPLLLEKSNRLWLDLENNLQLLGNEKFTSIEIVQQALMETDETIRTLKSWVITHDFDCWESEITFFKKIKPRFIAKFIFYSKLIAYLASAPYGGEKLVKRKLESEFESLRLFSSDNQDFIAYYRKNATFLDKKYFVRFQYDLYVKLAPDLHSFDDRFATSYDHVIAQILANDDYEVFLKKQWRTLRAFTSADSEHLEKTLTWSASKTALTELVFALHQTKCINNGAMDLSELVRLAEGLFHVDLGNYHKTFAEIKARKSEPTKFLAHLNTTLLNHISQSLE